MKKTLIYLVVASSLVSLTGLFSACETRDDSDKMRAAERARAAEVRDEAKERPRVEGTQMGERVDLNGQQDDQRPGQGIIDGRTGLFDKDPVAKQFSDTQRAFMTSAKSRLQAVEGRIAAFDKKMQKHGEATTERTREITAVRSRVERLRNSIGNVDDVAQSEWSKESQALEADIRRLEEEIDSLESRY